jgi:hypothetical protein
MCTRVWDIICSENRRDGRVARRKQSWSSRTVAAGVVVLESVEIKEGARLDGFNGVEGHFYHDMAVRSGAFTGIRQPFRLGESCPSPRRRGGSRVRREICPRGVASMQAAEPCRWQLSMRRQCRAGSDTKTAKNGQREESRANM